MVVPMIGYIIRRLLMAIPTIFGVILIVFLMVRLLPGDPALVIAGEQATKEEVERIRHELGLDKPMYEQFFIFIGKLFQGDLGRSVRSKRPVVEDLIWYFSNTLQLALGAITFATVIGIIAGVISATKPHSLLDYAITFGSLLGISMPTFWFGLLLQLFFAVWLGWFPAAGMGSMKHAILPTITMGLFSLANIMRITRSGMLESLSKAYVKTAMAKGLKNRTVIYKHALRNALIPIITIVGLQFGTLLAGAVLTETVFGWPGIGRLLVDSILARDYPVVQGAVLLIAIVFMLVNLVTDILYAYVDPRIHCR
jgi:peptide/nickel transport system permease protein/oligopeptide transport system permease protein